MEKIITKVLILCGGKGIRPSDRLTSIPKGLVTIGGTPILIHIMRRFAMYGHKKFVLALGEHGDQIVDYFLKYKQNSSNVKFSMSNSKVEYLDNLPEDDWEISFVQTGKKAGTGTRIARCQDYLDSENFYVTYSDCLSDVDIDKLTKSHFENNKVMTVTGAQHIYRYGTFVLDNKQPREFSIRSKITSYEGPINGGYIVSNKKIFDYLNRFNECVLENEVFNTLIENKELNLYFHEGFWYPFDSDRDREYLESLWDQNEKPWIHF